MFNDVELKTLSVTQSALRFINKSVYDKQLAAIKQSNAYQGMKTLTNVTMHMVPDAPYFNTLKEYVYIDKALQSFYDNIDINSVIKNLRQNNTAVIRFNNPYSHAIYSQFFIEDNTFYMTHTVSDAEINDGCQYEFISACAIFYHVYGYLKAIIPNMECGDITYNIGMLYMNQFNLKLIF